MVTPKGHGREITMFNPCTGISLSGSALERHSIVSRNVNLHRCQAQDIISNGKLWMGQITDASNVYIYIYICISRCVRSTQSYVKWIHLYLSRLSVAKRLYLSPSSNLSDRSFSQTCKIPNLFFYITHACSILNTI